MWWFLFILVVCLDKCEPQYRTIKTTEVAYDIGGIFESDAKIQKLAFNDSARFAHLNDHSLKPFILQPTRSDSYSVWRELCKTQSKRPIAIFGPQNAITDGAIRDQCAIANIPHIQATWQPFDPDLDLDEELTTEETNEDEPPTYKKISINFYPDSDDITFAYAMLLKYYKWENFAALYEDDYGLLRIQKILAATTTKYPVTVRKLDPNEDNHEYGEALFLLEIYLEGLYSVADTLHIDDYDNNSRPVFKDMQKYQESRLLLDCHIDRVAKYMDVAEQLKMVNPYQHYILMTMDTSMLAEQLTKYNSNITWLSMMEYDKLTNAQHVLSPRVGGWKPNSGSPVVADFPLEALVMDDITNHLLVATKAVEEEAEVEDLNPPVFTCDPETEPWEYGAALQNKILKNKSTGVTGNLEFDDRGRRVNYTLYVNEIHLMQRQTIGRWQSADRGDILVDRINTDNNNNKQKFIVISRYAKPYFAKACEGSDCPPELENKYEGFSVELVDAIFQELRKENYNYTHEFMPIPLKDATYGKYDETTKKWNGLIGYLLDKKADLAVCDLTITEERKKVVDFSVPFMSLGISILYTKDIEPELGMFSFTYPYSFEVWLYIATAYCVVSIALFVCARISTADWENPQPCDKDPEELENIWNFKNCTWLTMGSIMTQGCDILPKAFGTRWICGMWWFFAVIVCQTYIAQLSASMTSAMDDAPINSVEDLAKQTKIRYGAIDGASTYQFFKNSQDKTYHKIYENMAANPGVLVRTNEEGESRVIKGKSKYAFFMESSSIEYKLRRNCDLKKVGPELDSKDYGIAMPANSPFRSQINRAILKLKEHTKLDEIKNRWWNDKDNALDCGLQEVKDENDVEGDLEFGHLVGAFVVLAVGLVFSLFITAAEFMNEVRNIVVREEITQKEAFIKELKASLNFFQLQKPVLRNPSRAPSIAASDKSDVADKISRRAMVIGNFLDFEKQGQ